MAVCTDTVIMNSQSLKEGKDAENDRNELETEFETLLKQQNSSLTTPREIIKQHIKQLKEYNELRDTGLRLVQIVADDKNCSLKEVVEEIGYAIKDE
ncbi:pachytene arrest protein Sae3p [Monosporozyma servazzii]